MPNYGKYYIGVRLLLLKEYLQANAGKTRIVKRKELEDYLMERGFPVEKKTLYADFAVLDDVFGLHLEYDKHKADSCVVYGIKNKSDLLLSLIFPRKARGLSIYRKIEKTLENIVFSRVLVETTELESVTPCV